MSYWDILGIEKTDDIKAVKKAYAKMSKQYHPETHPDEFKQLHTAYKAVISMIKRGNIEVAPVLPQAPVTIRVQIPRQKEESNSRYTDFLAKVNRKYEQKCLSQGEEPLISEFRRLIMDEKNNYAPKVWRRFFTGDRFLERQYEPEFIHSLAGVIGEYMQKYSAKNQNVAGRAPTYMLLYCIIAYGCMFENMGLLKIKEKVYRKECLEELANVLHLQDSLLGDYLIVEQREELVGERFAFYVYRNILELLEYEKPNRVAIRKWLIEGMAKENRSHVLELLHYAPSRGVLIGNVRRQKNVIFRSPLIFELLEYLLHTKHSNLEVYEEVLKEVCLDGWDFMESREEKDILVLTIEENRRKREK